MSSARKRMCGWEFQPKNIHARCFIQWIKLCQIKQAKKGELMYTLINTSMYVLKFISRLLRMSATINYVKIAILYRQLWSVKNGLFKSYTADPLRLFSAFFQSLFFSLFFSRNFQNGSSVRPEKMILCQILAGLRFDLKQSHDLSMGKSFKF